MTHALPLLLLLSLSLVTTTTAAQERRRIEIGGGGDVLKDWPKPTVREGLTTDQTVSAIAEYAQQLADGDRFSGVVLVAKDGQTKLSRAWGMANAPRRRACASRATSSRCSPTRRCSSSLAPRSVIRTRGMWSSA